MSQGTIELIRGPMFARKSTELAKRMRDAKVFRVNFIVYNPAIDTRYGMGRICNHDGDVLLNSIPVPDSIALLNDVIKHPEVKLVGVDEAQFFLDGKLPKVVQYVTQEMGIDMVLAGLPHDYRGEVFGPMGELASIAHRVTNLTAICTHELSDGKQCNSPAYFTQRFDGDGQPVSFDGPTVEIGGRERYTARCADHWQVPGRPRIDIDTLLK